MMKNLKLLGLLVIFVSVNVFAEERQIFIVEFYEEPLAVEYGGNFKEKSFSNNKRISKNKLIKSHNDLIDELFKQNKSSTSLIAIKHEYFYAFNGLSVALTQREARFLQQHPQVKSIGIERYYNLHTDIGPQWIGADKVWDGLALDTPPNRGEGVVIGIIDTGINPSHPSFQAVSEAGTSNQYTHTNPRGTTFGLCNASTCNAKLIGIFDFTDEGTAGIDSVGHGSHVAGIAAGNVYSSSFSGLSFNVSGVAPRANIISYKACFFTEEASGGSCSSSALLASIDEATNNQVDVVNYSIGSEIPCSPWAGLDNNGSFCNQFGAGQAAAAMLNARNAGVLFVVSAGNSGPGASTVGYPAIAPWVIAAANTTHSRQLQSSVVNFIGGDSILDDLVGASASQGIGPLKIVHAKDFGNALCGQGDPELKSLCNGSGNDVLTGATNPFAANTFNGEIVVCDRGSYGRIEKGFNVLQAGAGGYILANTVGQQESIVADSHCLPATHLGNIAGSELRNWLDSGSNHTGEITGQTLVYEDALGDVMNSSSSRGPVKIVFNTTTAREDSRHPQNYMKPNLSAPGSSILSATQEGAGLTTKSGTSMSSPHIAGAVALIKSAHPNYTPSQLVSSLILTADNTQMLKEDKATKAEFSDQGAGRTNVNLAIGNSLYFDVSRQEFINANPQNGADISQLNLPELVNDNCYPTCSFTRKVKFLNSFNVVDPVWKVTTEQSNGLTITVTPNSFDFNSSTEITLNIVIDTTANDVLGDWAEAKILFTLESSSNSDPLLDTLSPSVSKLPVAVFVPAGNYPNIVTKQVATRHGNFDIDLNNIASMTNATYIGLGLKVPITETFSLSTDPNNSPFEDTQEAAYDPTGSSFSLFEVKSEKQAVIIESSSTGFNGANLYVGKDLNINNTPDEFEAICLVNDPSASKRCVLKDVKPGIYWILTNNKSNNGQASITTELTIFDSTDSAKKADFELGIGSVKGTGLFVKAPVKVESNTLLTVTYELPAQLSQTNHYYGLIAVGADPSSVGKTAIIPLKITASNPTNQKLYSLNNEVAEFNYVEDDVLSNMYVDTGINATKIMLRSFEVGYQVNFYRTDFDFDPLNIKPDLSVLTPEFTMQSFPTLSPGVPPPGFVDFNTAEIDVSTYPPSRWYIETLPNAPSASQAGVGYFAIDAQVVYAQDGLIEPNQSLWFNPARNGWGIDLSQSTSSQAITWYTYNDHGTLPIWLQATASITQQNQWRGDMNWITWTGTSPKLSAFGSISMVYTSANTGVISISTPDKTYTEKLVSIYSPENNCPQINNNQQLDVTGLWFLPDQSGFGSTVLATESNETTIFYHYDDSGLPVWAIGDRALTEEITVMNQVFGGFCPDCEFSAISLTPIGSVINQYTAETSGSISSNLQLLSPLSGHWISNGDSIKLNKDFGCIRP